MKWEYINNLTIAIYEWTRENSQTDGLSFVRRHLIGTSHQLEERFDCNRKLEIELVRERRKAIKYYLA